MHESVNFLSIVLSASAFFQVKGGLLSLNSHMLFRVPCTILVNSFVTFILKYGVKFGVTVSLFVNYLFKL